MMSVHHLLHLQLQQQQRMMLVFLLCYQQFPAQLQGHCPNQPLTHQYHPVFTTLQFQKMLLLSHPVNQFLKLLPIEAELFENLPTTLTDYWLYVLPLQVASTIRWCKYGKNANRGTLACDRTVDANIGNSWHFMIWLWSGPSCIL